MIAVKCPRCEREWYTEEEDAGRVRLCSACADELRRKRLFDFSQLEPFVVVSALLLLVDIVLIVLTSQWPEPFGRIALTYGLLLLAVGLGLLRYVAGFVHIGHVDWSVARWPALIALMGLACVLAFFSFVGIR